jgi:hypothetical protein
MQENILLDASHSSLKKVLPLLLVCLLALLLRIWGISFGLPGIDHGDESEVVNHAVRFGSGDLNPHRFQYGSLMQYLLFFIYGCYYVLASLVGRYDSTHQFAVQFVSDPTVFYMIARVLSACLGTATVWMAYVIGRRVRDEGTGLLAALLLAVCYQHVVHSHYATVDAAVTFLFSCAVYRSLMTISDKRLFNYLSAGFFTGLAAGTKFNGIIALVVLTAAHWSGGSGGTLIKRFISREWLLGLAAVIAGHFIACPYFYLDLDTAWQEVMALQSFHASSGFTLWYYLRDFSLDYWGIPAGIVCAAGVARYLPTRAAGLRMLAIAALAVILFASRHRYVEAKYILCAFPLAAVLGASLLNEGYRMLPDRLRPTIALVALLVLVVHPLSIIIRWDADRAGKSITLESKEWIERHLPPQSRILLDNAGNAGPKLANAPENIRRQYDRAREHNLIKADYLKLLLEIEPTVYYDIVELDVPAGSRTDDYQRHRLWQDTDVIGMHPSYYCERGYDYIIVTKRNFARVGEGFLLLKEFARGDRGIRIYQVSCGL